MFLNTNKGVCTVICADAFAFFISRTAGVLSGKVLDIILSTEIAAGVLHHVAGSISRRTGGLFPAATP